MTGGIIASVPASGTGPGVKIEQWKPGDIVATLEWPNGVRLLGTGQTPQDAFDDALGKMQQAARGLIEPPAPRPGIRPLLVPPMAGAGMTEEEFRQRDERAVVQYRRIFAGSRALTDAWRAYYDELHAYGWIDPRSFGPAMQSPVLYISEAGRVVAFAIYDALETGGLWLSHVWVSPQRRRAGLFGKLWARLVEMAKADGRETIELCVHPDNDRAKFLYNRAGCTTKWLHLELDMAAPGAA